MAYLLAVLATLLFLSFSLVNSVREATYKCSGSVLDLLRAFLINEQTKIIATSALLSGVMEKIDESYWAAMRRLEEAAMLMK